MKHNSLLWKLLALFLAVSVSFFVILNTLGLSIMQSKMLNRTKNELYQCGTGYVSEYLLDYYERGFDQSALLTEFRLLGDLNDTRIWLVNNNGNILMDSEGYATKYSLK